MQVAQGEGKSETSQQRDPQKAIDSYKTPAHPRTVSVS